MASSKQKLHIVVTCTERKTVPVPDELRLRDIPHGPPAARAAAWTRRLRSAGDRRPALDLYKGEHWVVAKRLPGLAVSAGLAAASDVRLWVCSAGYGLISADAFVRPYAATLTPGHADSVSDAGGGIDGQVGANAWWRAIADWEGPTVGESRSFSALAASAPDATFLLVLSAHYLKACAADIAQAAAVVTDVNRFLIVSAGTRATGEMGRLLLPGDARLQAGLGGTRGVLNVRISAALLEHTALNRSSATSYLSAYLAASPGIVQYDRKPMSDTEIMDWTAAALRESPDASASRLLRRFRDAGFACEQSRFSQLYRACPAMPSRTATGGRG